MESDVDYEEQSSPVSPARSKKRQKSRTTPSKRAASRTPLSEDTERYNSDQTTKSKQSTASTKRRKSLRQDTNSPSATEQPTIYDLVSGRVRLPVSTKSLYRGERYTRALTPAEHYFKRLHPKTGNEEEDSRIYWSPETDKHDLPSSDLLWAIHRYASHKFGEESPECLKSMDETALIAMGILLEESVKESMGKDGYLSLLVPEGSNISEDERVGVIDSSDEASGEDAGSENDSDSSEDDTEDNSSQDESDEDATEAV